MDSTARMYRSRRNRILGGVAGGMSDYFAVDPMLVRIGWLIAACLTAGLMVLVYLAMWALFPDEGSQETMRGRVERLTEQARASSQRVREGKRSLRDLIGIALLLVGGIILLGNLGVFVLFRLDLLFPVVLIGTGALLVFRKGSQKP